MQADGREGALQRWRAQVPWDGGNALTLYAFVVAGTQGHRCSRSNHRYATTDYTQVDALLGGNDALVALRQATTARSMRLVLDAVVNHTSAHHPWVAGQPGAYARHSDGQPLGWKDHALLPVLDFAVPAVPAVPDAIYAAPCAKKTRRPMCSASTSPRPPAGCRARRGTAP